MSISYIIFASWRDFRLNLCTFVIPTSTILFIRELLAASEQIEKQTHRERITGNIKNIDNDSLLNTQKDILISAPLEKVWSELNEINQWPEWQPDVAFSKLDGKLAEGTLFHWKANCPNITSTIQEFEPMHRIGWTGKSVGIKAIHI